MITITDDLWFKKLRLQDQLDQLLQEFEERNKIEIQKIEFIRLGNVRQIYSQVRIEHKKDI